ncbi:MAG: serine/threonine protein kinase [Sandaracinaceae bacterium]|nr:serine/threonine protein kinase [Sandaracinaceae bacterium]
MPEARFVRCVHCGLPHEVGTSSCPLTGYAVEPMPSTSAAPARDGSLVGTIIDGKYEVLELLGQGSMGKVYRANNPRIRREVAIKVLQRAFVDSPMLKTRFLREAQLTAKIQHPNVVQIWDAGVTDGELPFIVMELVRGETLAERIARQSRLGLLEASVILGQVLRGLLGAHAVGVVHRDVKPENVLIAEDDTVKIVDFGIARALAEDATVITQTGHLVGTPSYLSPEQALGREVDHKTDAWSATVLLYEALTGRVPFEGRSVVDILNKVISEEAPPPSRFRPDLSPGYDDLVALGLRKDPASRADAGLLLACLSTVQHDAGGADFGDTMQGDPTFEAPRAWARNPDLATTTEDREVAHDASPTPLALDLDELD